MSAGGERFSEAERALLAPYVTNTEGSVFALTNLPEVIKGALFSRYSRSRLGLREVLLKEFIQQPEAEFFAIGGTEAAGGEAAARSSHLAVERAQDFYDRILDGYGDDSIGEMGGAHLALENVSMIATKVLEDARIGGSPLEKSTRYVSFAEQQDGDFRFFKEPALMASRHREPYLALMRSLFETYRDMIEPLTAHVHRVAPRPKDVSEAVYRRTVRARVLDALRGLLPASTLTNMGIFGNGRFFEKLLLTLRLSDLAELQELAGPMDSELRKVIPSFIRRANPKHPHFEGFRDFGRNKGEFLKRLARELPPPSPAGEAPTVELVDFDPGAEAKILAALVYPATDASLPRLQEWAEGLDTAERERIFRQLGDLRGNRRHKPPRALEMVYYTFDLLGDFGIYRDLHRHRLMTQVRQTLSTRLGHVVPEELAETGLEERFGEMMARAAELHEAVAPDFPAEAQYLVPMAFRIRWLVRLNLRELMWLVELRSTPQGHPAYRAMAQEMYRKVLAVQPALAGLMRFVDLADYPLGRMGAEQRQEEKNPSDRSSAP